MFQEIEYTKLFLQTKENAKLTFITCQVLPKPSHTPTKKVGVHSITEANYQTSGESIYPKLSLSKIRKNSLTLKSSPTSHSEVHGNVCWYVSFKPGRRPNFHQIILLRQSELTPSRYFSINN